MSTQQILGVVGAAVGWWFGYPQLGFVVGSLIGAALTPKQKSEGPRLDDLKVTVSTYGAGIPTLYGSARLGGNVIFSTDKIEIPTTTSTGKGGGSENTTYQAFVHMAVALCYGEIDGIRKIWKDGKLIYDASSGIPVGSAIASATSPYSRLTLYYGTETQLPDPVQEIYLGAGNAPAYRGIAYVQMNAVECPGGRVPQFSFEVVTAVTSGIDISVLITEPTPVDQNYGGVVTANGTTHFRFQNIADNNWNLHVFFAQEGELQEVGNYFYEGFAPFGGHRPYPISGTETPKIIWPYGSAGMVHLDLIDLQTGVRVNVYSQLGTNCPGFIKGRASYDQTNDLYAFLSDDDSVSYNDVLIVNQAKLGISCELITGNPGLVGFYGGVLHIISADGTTIIHSRRTSTGAADAAMPETTGPTLAGIDLFHAALNVNEFGVFAYILHSGGTTIYKIIPATIASPGSWTVLFDDVGYSTANSFSTASNTFYANDTMAIIGPIPATDSYNLIRFGAMTLQLVNVADIIAAQCLRAGLTSGQFDVSTITDTVHGYTIANPASARNNIQPLMTAYGIDAREEDGKIEFFKRSAITSVVTVPYVELGCVEGEGDAGDPMPLSHGQEAELPRAVNVNYINPGFDYQTGTERAKRQVTLSQLDETIDMPISTNADHAASVAQMILYDAWNDRNKRSAKVSRKYAAVSAGDGVSIEYPEGTTQRWRLTKVTDTGVMCEWEVVPADESIYTQTAIGAPGYDGQGQQVAPLPTPTRMQLIDGPILRDQDDNAGLYVAAEGFGPGWRGYTLYVGDDATNLQSRGGVTTPASIGFAEDALGGWTGGLMDETNSVTVDVGTDVLNNTTRDLMFTSSVNLALIGDNGRWEAIQFRTATDLGDGRYRLTSLLRGLFGTERFTDTHALGDRFVLMSVNGTLRPSMDFGSIGQEIDFRPVSLGGTLQSGVSQTYANTAEGLKPRSPWDLRKSNAASNDQTLTWERRTRLSSNALRGIVPLGETSEAYSLDFYTSGAFSTVGGTLDSTTRSLTITSAQQTAFGLTPGAALNMRVYQISQSVGRGAPLEAIV